MAAKALGCVQRIIDLYYEQKPYRTHYALEIEKGMRGMSKKHREFLLKDLAHDTEKKWWKGIYSKSSYYRIREASIDSFVNCLRDKRML